MRLHHFSHSGHPDAPVACYVASWQLPRPDLHRLADDSFRDTRAPCYAAHLFFLCLPYHLRWSVAFQFNPGPMPSILVMCRSSADTQRKSPRVASLKSTGTSQPHGQARSPSLPVAVPPHSEAWRARSGGETYSPVSPPGLFDHTFVFVVRTNPNPDEVFSIVNRKCPVVDSDSDRPKLAHFLETKRWV